MEPDAVELRILGCLIEKQRTTPDAYPLTLNALRLACNQSTNRDPVVDYDEATIRDGLQRLYRRRWTRLAGAGRASKYRHLLDEALGLTDDELALLAVLMLRGPQTPGELNQRAARLHPFGGLDAIHATLERLIRRELAERLPRRPGQKEERYVQRLGASEGDEGGPATAPAPYVAATTPVAAPAPPSAATPVGSTVTTTPDATGVEDADPRVGSTVTTTHDATGVEDADPRVGSTVTTTPDATGVEAAGARVGSSAPGDTDSTAAGRGGAVDAARVEALEREVAELRGVAREVDELAREIASLRALEGEVAELREQVRQLRSDLGYDS